jgi:hypothetical protein
MAKKYYSLEDLDTIIAHYEAIPILIDYISHKASEGDSVAKETLFRWDKARDGQS